MTMPGIDRTDRIVFVWMLREEWRLHSSLFGGRRFAAFPLLVAVLTAGGVVALVETGTSLDAVIAGLHALVFAFGLHTGTIGLVGRDAIDDVLGDVTLLVFSARTLPISRERLLGHFLAKDALYYSTLFLVPVVGAFGVAVGRTGLELVDLGRLWLSTTATFLLGLVVTLAVVGLATRGIAGWLTVGVFGVGSGVLWYSNVDLFAATPYALYAEPSLLAAIGTLVLLAGIAVVGVLAYDPVDSTPTRTRAPAFTTWRRRLRDDTGLTTKTLLDVARSSGGLWKVVFSGGIIFAVCVGLVELAERITGVEPSVGVTFGPLLGLSAYTTYNWITQYDDPASYLRYPLEIPDLFAAKRAALVLVGLPTAAGYYLLAVVLVGTGPVDALTGLVLLIGYHQYLFGLTAALAGFDPNEFLFDTVLFVVFTAAVAIVLVPVLVVGLVITPLTSTALLVLVTVGVGLFLAGELCYRYAGIRWSSRLEE